jgi:type IX secretion system PorP/SprF family membrane protein
MRYFRSILLAAFLSLAFVITNAQQVPMYSQYIMNGFLINPSYAGNDGYTTVNLTARQQWVGFSGAPGTYAASFQTRILKTSYISKSTSVRRKMVRPTKGGRVGLGGYLFDDQNGIIRRTGISGSYAYHIPLGQNQLSFGLSANAYQYAIDLNGAVLYDSDDDYLNNYDRVVFIPDFNFGVSYSTDTYYAGFAMNSMFRGIIMLGNSSKNARTELGHFFLSGGMKFVLPNNNWSIEPSALLKSSDMLFKSVQMDLTTRIRYTDQYWAGLSWRTGDAIILLMGLKYDRFHFGYAFDFTLSDIRKQSFGSHEITIAVKFGDSARRYRWINSY